ncbi:hypothetical protein GFS60_07628 (plasmid) [Rhodococcus sp. WAY2]|nr:hypothetical protein GFS60_07628 [Rhodococcus sp. WAY2]
MRPRVAVVNDVSAQWVTLHRPQGAGLVHRPLHERGLLRRRHLPTDDRAGERIDDERRVREAGHHPDVREVRDIERVGPVDPEVPVDQIRRPRRRRLRHGGADPLRPAGTAPPVDAHEPFDGAAGHLDALTAQVGPHLQRAVQRLRPASTVLVPLDVVGGQHRGDGGVPQWPFRQRPAAPGVEGSRGDRAPVLGEHPADRYDPELIAVFGDEPADHLRGGSHSRAKKDVADFNISMVFSSSAFFRRKARSSASASDADAAGVPPPAASALRTHTRTVSVFSDIRSAIVRIASYSEAYSSRCSRTVGGDPAPAAACLGHRARQCRYEPASVDGAARALCG